MPVHAGDVAKSRDIAHVFWASRQREAEAAITPGQRKQPVAPPVSLAP